MTGWKRISSPANPLVKEVHRAVQRGELTRDGWAVAESPHLLAEALRSGREVAAVLVTDSGVEKLKTEAPWEGLPVTLVAEGLWSRLAATPSSQGVISLVRPPTWNWAGLLGGKTAVVVLDGVQDPGNAGAIVRAAEAFGATGVVFVKGSAWPWHPKTLRASAGSLFRVPVLAGVTAGDAIQELARAAIPLWAAEPRAALTLADAGWRNPCAVVIGSEGQGVSPEFAGRAAGFRIPTRAVESLNAAVAAGIVLYEMDRQRRGSAV